MIEQDESLRMSASYDPEKAVECYKKGAELDDPLAQYAYARMLDIGEGVAQSYKNSLYWYLESFSRNPESSYALGRFYQYGLGVKKSIKEAINYYTIAANAGLSEAEIQLDLLKPLCGKAKTAVFGKLSDIEDLHPLVIRKPL